MKIKLFLSFLSSFKLRLWPEPFFYLGVCQGVRVLALASNGQARAQKSCIGPLSGESLALGSVILTFLTKQG